MSEKLIDSGDLCMRTLAKAGVTDMFALHGGHIDPILMAAKENGVRLIDFRHEAAVGHAADAYARLTGKCAVAVGTAGPGLTNMLTAITNCYVDCVPVLFLTSAAPLRLTEMNLLQGGFDQLAMAKPVTKFAKTVTQVDMVPRLIKQAMQIAVNGKPGPVLLEIPIDIMYDKIPDDGRAKIPDIDFNGGAVAPTVGQLESAIELLQNAERPAIICGGGMMFSKGAEQKLLEFADASNIPVFLSNKAVAAFPGNHDLFGGEINVLRMIQSRAGKPDLVMMLGARFGMHTGGGIVPSGCKIIQVDINQDELSKVRSATLGIGADITQTLDGLLQQEIAWPNWSEWSTKACKSKFWHKAVLKEACEKSPSIHPYHAVMETLQAMPPKAIVCPDGGHATGWVHTAFANLNDNKYAGQGYLGCLGIGVPFGVGSQVAYPDRPVVVITGDGALGFNLPEWDTMVRFNLPVVTVVLNNSAWGISTHGQAEAYGLDNLTAVQLNETNYEKVAEGFGCYGERVEKAEDIGPAVQRAFASGRPACINVIVDVMTDPADPTGKRPLPKEKPEPDFDYRTHQVVPYYGKFKR